MDERRDPSADRSERLFRALADAAEGYAAVPLDADGRISGWNAGARRLTGYESEAAVGAELSLCYSPADRDGGVPERELAVANEHGSCERDRRWIDADGRPVPVTVTHTAERDADGALEAYTTVVRRRSDRAEGDGNADATERESRAEPEDVYGRMTEGVLTLDGSWEITYVNDRAAEILERDGATLRGQRLWEAFPDLDDTAFGRRYREAMTSREPTPVEGYYAPLDVWFDEYVYPAADGLSIYFRDVTEQRRLCDEFEQTFSRISDAFYSLDTDWTVTYANDRAEELLGFPEEGIVGRNIWEVFGWIDRPILEDRYRTVMDTQEATTFEYYYPDPLETWFEFHVYPSETGLSVYFRDISDRKRRERELEESERRYRTLVDYFPNGIVTLFNHECRYTLAAGQAFDELPIDAADVEGEYVEDVWSSEIGADLRSTLEAALDGAERTVEFSYADREWVLRAVPITDDRGNVFAGMSMAQDVTDQKARERYFRDAKSQLEAATEAGAIGTWEWRIGENRVVTGPSFARTFGIDPEAAREGVPIETLFEAVHEDDRDRAMAEIETAVESGSEFESEYRVRDDDGEVRWVVARGRVEYDDDGAPETFPGALTDITNRKEAEIALERSQAQLETLFDILPVGIMVATRESGFVKTNDVARELWGRVVYDVDPTAAAGCSATWVDTGEPVDSEEWTMARVLEGEEVTDPDIVEIDAADGERRTVMAHGMPIRDDGDAVTRGVVTLTEITERRASKRKLEETVTMLETSNERLEHFAYAASHDLQEPLRMVSTYLTLIENRYDDELDEDGREFLAYAVDGADRMRDMIEGLLAYSRVETRGQPPESVDLGHVVDDVLTDLQVRIRVRDATIDVESMPRVRGDPHQLRQLFQNLVENALKYGGEEPPRIRIDAEREGSMWAVSVRDDGIGIGSAEQTRIFEVFQRLHSPEEYEGTGIGLALCQRIVERHGGEIRVDSGSGEGSTFTATLPAADP